MKVRASVKPRCESCKVIRRNRVVMISVVKTPSISKGRANTSLHSDEKDASLRSV